MRSGNIPWSEGAKDKGTRSPYRADFAIHRDLTRCMV